MTDAWSSATPRTSSESSISWIRVCHSPDRGYVYGLQLGYGNREGAFLGFQTGGLEFTNWVVPVGEQIVRIDGEIAGYYVSRLRFITDMGSKSPLFGGMRGTPFVASDPNGLPLRTISPWANLKRHPSLNRAVTSVTFKFGRPIPFEPLGSDAKVELLTRFAPRVWFHPKEAYWPSSVEWSFNFLKRYWSSKTKMWWLLTREPLERPSSVLAYFHGADPRRQWTDVPLKLEDVPVYAFWRPIDEGTIDLIYFFYCPYNRRKEVASTMFGSHVGDWEHVTVRLTAQRNRDGKVALAPSANPETMSFSLSYHSKDARYAWATVAKVPGSEHPIIYSANGSHGSYLDPGGHRYESAAGKNLVDYTDAGTAWETWKAIECFDHEAGTGLGPTWVGRWPNWLRKDDEVSRIGNEDPASGPVTGWGNYRWGAVNTVIGGTPYRLSHGPTGPVDKPCFTTSGLD